jgi:tetratricopeptide (TPR) repeat protein
MTGVAVRLLTYACLAICLSIAHSVAFGQAPGRDAALAALKSADAAARHRAIIQLADVGLMADVPPLIGALRDADQGVRAVAEQAIWVIWSRSGDPKIDQLFAEGIGEMNAGRFAESIALFSRIIETKPDFAEGWNKRATLYFLVGDYDKSLKDCDEVIKRNPQHFGALSGYGQIYLRLNEPEKALGYFQRALAVNPNLVGVEFQIRLLERHLEEQRKNKV